MAKMAITSLTQAQCTLRLASPVVASLPHVVSSVSAFLDTCIAISLPAAAASRSVRLLDRVATRLLNGDVVVSPSRKEHLFALALTTAIKNDDLLMVQKIHSLHAEPLVVPSLALAVEFGSLELVQWVVAHRSDQTCCAPGVKNLCAYHVGQMLARVGPQDAVRVVPWLTEACGQSLLELWGGSMHWQFLRSSVRSMELLRWLVTENLLKPVDIDNALFYAVEDPTASVETVHYLVDVHLNTNQGSVSVSVNVSVESAVAATTDSAMEIEDSFITSLFMASLQRENEGKVEYLLSTPLAASFQDKVVYAARQPGAAKVLQWSREVMDNVEGNPGRILNDFGLALRAAHYCHVETIRWLHEERGLFQLQSAFEASVREEDVLELFAWMVQVDIKRNRWPPHLFDQLAGRGFLQAAIFVQSHGVGRSSSSAMDIAAGQGHLDTVVWLHGQHGYEGNTTLAMTSAAAGGHIDVLEWLHANGVDGCITCVLQWLLERPRSVINSGLTYGSLPVLTSLQWLEGHQSTVRSCERDCMPAIQTRVPLNGPLTCLAASAGDRHLVEYLHEHHRELFALSRADPSAVSRTIVRAGLCVNVAKWLYTHHRESFDWGMILAGCRLRRNVSVQQWLQDEMARVHADNE